MADADLELVLPAASSVEPQTFGGAFPGVWRPGVPQRVSTLGLTAEGARRLVALHGLPLVEARTAGEPRQRPRDRKAD